LNKLLNPAHASAIFQNFYHLPALSAAAAAVLGVAQVLVSLAIIAGFLRTVSYGPGVVIHATSTLATLPHLLLPFGEGSNLLFMAGVPVLAGAVGLFLARHADTLLSADTYWARTAVCPARS
jgi:putative oxidoreductase